MTTVFYSSGEQRFAGSALASGGGGPTLSLLTPDSGTEGSGATSITATGANFTPLSTIEVDGVPSATTYVSTTKLTFTMSAAQLASAGTRVVKVRDGGYLTGPQNFVVASGFTAQYMMTENGADAYWHSTTGESGSWTEVTGQFGSDRTNFIIYSPLDEKWFLFANQGEYVYEIAQSALSTATKRTISGGPGSSRSWEGGDFGDDNTTNGIIVATGDVTVGSLTRGCVSTDGGATWTSTDPVNSTNDDIGSTIWDADGQKFLSFCKSSFNRNQNQTTDGSTWTHAEKGTDRGRAATDGSGNVIETDFNSTNWRYSTDNGANWTGGTGSGPNGVNEIVWCPAFGTSGYYIAVCNTGSNRFYYLDASDITTNSWTAATTTGSSYVWTSVAYNTVDNRVIAASSGTGVAYSDDGDTWTVYTVAGLTGTSSVRTGAIPAEWLSTTKTEDLSCVSLGMLWRRAPA